MQGCFFETEAALYSQMESPEGWAQFANATYPQLVGSVAGEALANTALASRFTRTR